MLRIEKESDEFVMRLLVSGHIQSSGIGCIQSAMKDARKRKLLDLSEVTLVDIAAIHFLIRCEKEGVELAQCPSFVREWMLRERAEEP
jgi:hypothetical protein